MQTVMQKVIDFVRELADEPCEYGDNCPDFVKLNHYKCLHCKARAALEEEDASRIRKG